MKVFESLTEALRQGYHVHTRVPEGYLVRTRVRDRWALALVSLRRPSDYRNAWRQADLGHHRIVPSENAGRLDGR
jgi:hypothetical protein